MQKGSHETVRVLLSRVANPNVTDAVNVASSPKSTHYGDGRGVKNNPRFFCALKNGNLPLHLACANGDLNSAQLLCENGSSINVHNGVSSD